MNIAISTANLYFLPFEKVLEIYKKAGYEYIELAGYWKGGDSEIAQHLKDIKPKDALKLVHEYGLKISSLHDMGGLIEDGVESVISQLTYEYLEHYDFPCLVFHTPRKKGADANWWNEYKHKAINDLQCIKGNRIICMENIYSVKYYSPIITPEDMLSFVEDADVFVNIDTTHYGKSGADISTAANVLKDRVKTIHLSDYADQKEHLFFGDGILDFKSFFSNIDINRLHAITIEYNGLTSGINDEQFIFEKAKEAKTFVERVID